MLRSTAIRFIEENEPKGVDLMINWIAIVRFISRKRSNLDGIYQQPVILTQIEALLFMFPY